MTVVGTATVIGTTHYFLSVLVLARNGLNSKSIVWLVLQAMLWELSMHTLRLLSDLRLLSELPIISCQFRDAPRPTTVEVTTAATKWAPNYIT